MGGALEDRIKPQVLADLKRLKEIKENKVSAEIEAAESGLPLSCVDWVSCSQKSISVRHNFRESVAI